MTCGCPECYRRFYCAARTRRSTSINVDAAREAPEVAAVLTGEDLKDKVGSLPCVAQAEHIPFHPVLAQGRVRYVDEPVMAVVATDPYSAQDALDIVEIDYEPLDAVIDPELGAHIRSAADPRTVRK
jgi:aerobic carbon-monoxide dehydrogenase large subunit